jgi:fructan beta-fructosidase
MIGSTKVSSFLLVFLVSAFMAFQPAAQSLYHEPHRPQIHFSPKENWINDPNGMVYYKGVYHLFFQHYPDSAVWGPMHWGHATSTDLIHWQQQRIALYPDSLGYIFSGSAVVDRNNTSGFGRPAKIPLIAIYTSHDANKTGAHSLNRENQSLAYSLDNGKTWIKGPHNPVLKNPGVADFRDPKIMWYEPGKKWIMTLAAQDRIAFYSSPNLKDWKKESEFGKDAGAHGGVWECPDLFELENHGKKVWVLIVNLNPGGPNKGSATQYFLGTFDGNMFVPSDTSTKWIDYGPDEYAGITWSNTGNRKIFLGWMSNWMYANLVPTEKWRNAVTIPRELKLQTIGKDMFVVSAPVKELDQIGSKPVVIEHLLVSNKIDVSKKIKNFHLPCRINFELDKIEEFSLIISNDLGEFIKIGFDKLNNRYFIDRVKSGKTEFEKEFAAIHTAPRLTKATKMSLSLIVDQSSLELFADNGLTVMTEIFFPNKPYHQIQIQSGDHAIIKRWTYQNLNSIWY